MTRMILAAAILAALAGCGRQSDLERPGPIFGPKDAATYGQQTRDQAAAAANASAAGEPGQPPQSGPNADPYANPAPPAQAPIPGEKTYPSGAPHTGG
ncbi:MAG TPA: lipoprotein [Caulobacteraceae bacterium]|jgi:predicted small lipoprotein YifL